MSGKGLRGSMVENNNVLLLFHGLQGFALSLAQILAQGEFVIRKWWRDIAFIPHQLGEAWPPVGIGRVAAVANTGVQRVCFVSYTQVSNEKVSLVRRRKKKKAGKWNELPSWLTFPETSCNDSQCSETYHWYNRKIYCVPLLPHWWHVVDSNVCPFTWDETYYVVADANTCDIDASHLIVQNMLLVAYRLSKRKNKSFSLCIWLSFAFI